MRVEQGAPFVTPERASVRREEARSRGSAPGTASGSGDHVQISQEARDLHAGQAGGETSTAGTALDLRRFREARERIEGGLEESHEVLREVAERLLDRFGL